MAALTIGSLAKAVGIGVETVRFYERKGLLRRPARPRLGYRSYSEEAVSRIRFIRNAQTIGFSLQEVKELLALRMTAGTSCAALRSRAAAKVVDVERRLADLERIRAVLQSLVAACPGRGAVTRCPILQALDEPDISLPRRRSPGRRRGEKGVPMKSVDMKIDGMQCEGCAGTIQSVLSREPGVKSASVSFPNRSASVSYDPRDTDGARITEAVTKAGFAVKGRP